MKVVNIIALILVIVGAVNWGLVGIANVDLVTLIFGNNLFSGEVSVISKIVFILVGIAGLYSLTFFGKVCAE